MPSSRSRRSAASARGGSVQPVVFPGQSVPGVDRHPEPDANAPDSSTWAAHDDKSEVDLEIDAPEPNPDDVECEDCHCVGYCVCGTK